MTENKHKPPPICANCKQAEVKYPEFMCPPCKRGARKKVDEYLGISRRDVVVRGCLGSGMGINGEIKT